MKIVHSLRASPIQYFVLREAKPQNEELRVDCSKRESSKKSLKIYLFIL